VGRRRGREEERKRGREEERKRGREEESAVSGFCRLASFFFVRASWFAPVGLALRAGLFPKRFLDVLEAGSASQPHPSSPI
jgi:hypothetical protein